LLDGQSSVHVDAPVAAVAAAAAPSRLRLRCMRA
jgi:hypothetical protein